MQKEIAGLKNYWESMPPDLLVAACTFGARLRAPVTLITFLRRRMDVKFNCTDYTMSTHPLLIRYMKGVFNSRQPTLKYSEIALPNTAMFKTFNHNDYEENVRLLSFPSNGAYETKSARSCLFGWFM